MPAAGELDCYHKQKTFYIYPMALKLEHRFKLKADLFDWKFVSKPFGETRTPQECLTEQDKKYFTETVDPKFEADVYIFHIGKEISIMAKEKNRDALDSLAAFQKSFKRNFRT